MRYPSPGFTNIRPVSNVNQPISTTVRRSPLLPVVGQCGVQIGNRIFGGRSTELDDFPWLGLLRYLKRRCQKGPYVNTNVTLCYVMLCFVTLCYVTLRYVMLCYVTLRYVMLRYFQKNMFFSKINIFLVV